MIFSQYPLALAYAMLLCQTFLKKIFLRLSFDGPGGVLAHASFPTVGEIHFDDEENWLVNGARKDGYDLMWVSYFQITMFCLKIG